MGERTLEFFSGEQRVGVGRFHFDPATHRWWWDEAVFAIFGYPAGAIEPSWKLILTHVPVEEHELIQAALSTAERQPGRFSWSHRVLSADGQTRSVLVVGDSTPGADPASCGSPVQRRDHHTDTGDAVGELVLSGFVLDLTELRGQAARAAGTDAVDRSNAHRAVIEQAKGVLMLAYHIDADAAFALLAWHSQHTNRKVHAIAQSVVATVTTDGLPDTHLRTALDRILAETTDPAPGPTT
ncbi:ANTAR domain-containing protein [Microlunatus ginsengisoli]|uniref:PAS and ANTAR domain-containing protein n=1 Tax=Microlunatus ginsengisoli TaxID=363863 RepID=A0ABP7AJI2_9ACTN